VLLLLPYVPELAWLYLQWRAAEANTPHLRNRRAPDDDPDYLRWLNEQQRRRREEG